MKKKLKFTESQSGILLSQLENGTLEDKVDEVCRKLGITHATFYKWRRKYGISGESDRRKMQFLTEENHQLKKLVATLSLDKQMLQDVLKKNFEATAPFGSRMPSLIESRKRTGRKYRH